MSNPRTMEKCFFCGEYFPVEWEDGNPRVMKLGSCQASNMRERADAIECVQAILKVGEAYLDGVPDEEWKRLVKEAEEMIKSIS